MPLSLIFPFLIISFTLKKKKEVSPGLQPPRPATEVLPGLPGQSLAPGCEAEAYCGWPLRAELLVCHLLPQCSELEGLTKHESLHPGLLLAQAGAPRGDISHVLGGGSGALTRYWVPKSGLWKWRQLCGKRLRRTLIRLWYQETVMDRKQSWGNGPQA